MLSIRIMEKQLKSTTDHVKKSTATTFNKLLSNMQVSMRKASAVWGSRTERLLEEGSGFPQETADKGVWMPLLPFAILAKEFMERKAHI